MSPPSGSFDPHALLTHINWVRALARSLVPADVHLADDLTQDAWLAAIEKAPDTERPLGAWLATVVKNLVRQRHRDAVRREERERVVARSEALPPTSDHCETLAVHRALVDAVMGLEEPYRETIVLRFFEELSPSAIARRQAVPVATVKTRLARGLAQLRARLARTHGRDGRSWLLALIPFSKPAGGSVATTLGALLVSTKVKFAIAAALIVCGAIVVLRSSSHEEQALASTSNSVAPTASTNSHASTPTSQEVVDAPRDDRRPVAASIAKAAPISVPAAEPVMVLRGRVLDIDAQTRAGLRVCFAAGRRDVSAREFNVPPPQPSADAPISTTNPAGMFELTTPRQKGELYVDDEGWTTVLSSLCGPDSSVSQHVIVVAPHLEHAGRVVDEQGTPLAGARIEIQVARDLRLKFQDILDNSAERSWVTESDEQGRFTFADAPRVEAAQLGVTLAGYVALSQTAPMNSERDLELVLKRPTVKNGTVAGQVVDANGRPIPDARVSLGHNALCSSNQYGDFEMALPEQGPRDPWIAVKTGHLPAIQPASAAVQAGRAEPNEFVVLRLGPAPLAISGRVLDAADRPQPGMRVFVADPTYFGASDEIPLHVEGMLAGAPQRAELEKLMASAPEGSGPEDVLRNTSNAFWTFAETDANGRFTLEGLLDRDYHVAALDVATLLRIDSGPIAAGTQDALIRLPASAYLEHVRGQVVSGDGHPVSGVEVTPGTDVITVRFNEHSYSTMDFAGRAVLTDDQGHFAFDRLPREKVYLTLRSADVLPLEWARGNSGGIEAAAHGKLDQIVIQVELRYHFQVVGEPELADELSVLDGAGANVQLTLFEGTSRIQSDVLPLLGGRSSVLVVGESARTLVLSNAKLEVRRLPLELVRGQINVVRY